MPVPATQPKRPEAEAPASYSYPCSFTQPLPRLVSTRPLRRATLKRAKRRTVMFSPSLPTLCRSVLDADGLVLMKGCSNRQPPRRTWHLPSTIFSITGPACRWRRPGRDRSPSRDPYQPRSHFGLDEARIAGCNVHRDVLHQLLEVLVRATKSSRNSIQQHADLAAGVNVGSTALVGGGRPFSAPRPCPLAQHHKGILIFPWSLQRFQSSRHGRA